MSKTATSSTLITTVWQQLFCFRFRQPERNSLLVVMGLRLKSSPLYLFYSEKRINSASRKVKLNKIIELKEQTWGKGFNGILINWTKCRYQLSVCYCICNLKAVFTPKVRYRWLRNIVHNNFLVNLISNPLHSP